MPKYLVIVESPAKAKTIEKFLGKNYTVMASIGHIRDLPKSKMGIEIEDNFEPKYINIRGKGDIIKGLKKEAKKSDKIFLATDPDREGEAIAWHLAYILGLDESSECRVTFHEITKDAVKQAIKNPRQINIDLVDAQQARRILDRLVGYTISPILWRKVKKGLSAGRVQSVATKLICDKEKSIEAFNPEEYWKIASDVKKKTGGPKFELEFFGKQEGKVVLPNEALTMEIVDKITDNDYEVVDVETKMKKRNPPKPFTTSSLQQDASTKCNYSTKKTMIIAQQLYEGVAIKGKGTIGLITYMRTDSTRISEVAKEAAKDYILDHFGEKYLPNGAVKKTTKQKKEKVQDAHEAIRPTYIDLAPHDIESYLTKDQYKLYSLIWSRFMASEMAQATFESYNVKCNNNGYIFKTNGLKLVEDGFLRVYPSAGSKDKKIPHVEKGELLSNLVVSPTQHFTQPPARYTEASLVKEMEEKGIGRPSTYAPTISTILSRGYVQKEKKNLVPTELGFIIYEIMNGYFNQIINVDFTANMEREFDLVESGELPWKNVIVDFYGDFDEMVKKADEALEKIDLTEETDIDCEKCGNKMLIKHGRYGKFLACSNYPECQNTKAILTEIGIKCPLCENGQIVERKTKKFKTFYGCSEFPDCRFVSWDRPIEENCPKCESILVEKKTKKATLIKCSNAECDYKREAQED